MNCVEQRLNLEGLTSCGGPCVDRVGRVWGPWSTLFLGEPGGAAGTEAGVGRGWGWGGAGLPTARAPWLEAAGDSAAILVWAPGLCRQGVRWWGGWTWARHELGRSVDPRCRAALAGCLEGVGGGVRGQWFQGL